MNLEIVASPILLCCVEWAAWAIENPETGNFGRRISPLWEDGLVFISK